MKLTRLQYRALKIYARYHAATFSVGQILRSHWYSWLLLAVMAGAVWFFSASQSPELACLFLGVCLGAFLRDLGNLQVAYRIWPVTQQIINWQRVSELIESHEKDVN